MAADYCRRTARSWGSRFGSSPRRRTTRAGGQPRPQFCHPSTDGSFHSEKENTHETVRHRLQRRGADEPSQRPQDLPAAKDLPSQSPPSNATAPRSKSPPNWMTIWVSRPTTATSSSPSTKTSCRIGTKSDFAISHNGGNTKQDERSETEMAAQAHENPSKCAAQNAKAKSPERVSSPGSPGWCRQTGLGYEDWRYVSRRVRQKCDLRPAAKPKRLPRVLTADQFRQFYKVVDQADDVQHALMLRLLFYTGVRVSELCGIEVADVDLENCKIFVNQGKGARTVTCCSASLRHGAEDPHRRPSPEPLALPDPAMRAVLDPAGRADREEVRLGSGRRGDPARLPAPVHHLPDQGSGLADAELQLLTGHARRETLANLPARLCRWGDGGQVPAGDEGRGAVTRRWLERPETPDCRPSLG